MKTKETEFKNCKPPDIEYHRNGQLKSKVKWILIKEMAPPIFDFYGKEIYPKRLVENWVPTGEWVMYFPSGKLKSRKHYDDNGEYDGWCEEYYPSGRLMYKHFWVNGARHGFHEEFYPNGKTNWKCNFINGVHVGIRETFWQNGKIGDICEFSNDGSREYPLKTTSYWKTGKLRSIYHYDENGVEFGDGEEYDEKGTLYSKGAYVLASEVGLDSSIKTYRWREDLKEECKKRWPKNRYNKDNILLLFDWECE